MKKGEYNFKTFEEYEMWKARRRVEGYAFAVIGSTVLWFLLAFVVYSCSHKTPVPAKGEIGYKVGNLRLVDYSVNHHKWLPDTEDKQQMLADAIYWAEGGLQATYSYGIKSVRCNGEQECRRICLNTIRNNLGRYQKSGRSGTVSYLEFLQERYCPTQGAGLSQKEKELNSNWLGNVKWFMENPKEVDHG